MATVHLTEQRALFLHLPKTAGFSISSALEAVPGARPHPVRGMDVIEGAAAWAASKLGREVFEDLFSFAVVRNPWDWTVSGWRHVSSRKDAYGGHGPDCAAFVRGGWRDGLVRCPNPLKFASPEIFLRYHCIVTQWEHLCLSPDAPAPLSHVARFEALPDEVETLRRRLGIRLDMPHKNRSDRRDYRSYYTDELAEIVARKNERLISAFGYRFDI